MRPYIPKINNIIGEFKVIEDFGLKLINKNSKRPVSFVKVECIKCGYFYKGQYAHFKYGGRKCIKCDPKVIKRRRFYCGEIHGDFKIIKDLIIDKTQNNNRKVIAVCLKCNKQTNGLFFKFKALKRTCECKFELERTEDWIRIRKIRLAMLDRCYNFQNKNFPRYGARGILVCEEWLKSPKELYNWSKSNGYQPYLTIDRIDNNKGYSPENCRWTSKSIQARNRDNIISEETAATIKLLLLQGLTHKEIADIVKTTCHRVSNISKGATWKDI